MQFQTRYYFSEENLWSEFGIYKHMIFTDEAESCACGQCPFGKWT
ncbi:unnamed protein product [marine sediment metagenome]|uniref:Uncharacterized protein n=1 Tax=marine sediment metagenome TaxID=412755 RepID=X0VT83_9ZZZZ